MHFGKSQQYSNFKMSGRISQEITASQSPAALPQEPLTEFPWSEEDSVPESDDASCADDSLSPGVPNTQAGVYTESANDAAFRFGIRFTTEQFHETKLLKILSDANVPHYLYKDVMGWARDAALAKYTFNPTHTLRNAQVKYLEKWLQCQKCRPQQVPTNLPGPGDQVVQTTCFNFTNQLYSLVSDRALFGNLDNLDVNVDDPFGKYVPPNGLLSTVNLGQWYQSAYRHEVKDPKQTS
jgi:hypothetical protein